MQIHSRCVTSDHGCVEKHSSSRLEAFFSKTVCLCRWGGIRWLNYVPMDELHWIATGWGWRWLCSSLSFTGTFLSDWVIIRNTDFVYGHKNTLIKLYVAVTEIFQMRCLCERQQRPQYSHWHADQYVLNKASFHFFVWTQGTIFFTCCTVLFWFSPPPLHTHNTLNFVHLVTAELNSLAKPRCCLPLPLYKSDLHRVHIGTVLCI